MEYQEYQKRLKIRERIHKELHRLDFNLRDSISDPLDEKDIRLVNSKQWLHDIWQLYSEIRWSMLEAFSYLELDYQVAFLYYTDNAISRLYALREKIAQLINDNRNLGIVSKKLTFDKLTREYRNEISADLLRVLDDLKKNTYVLNLVRDYRHPKTHRKEPYVEEMDNYRFIMKKVSSKRIDLIAERGDFKWTIPVLREHLLRSYEAILNSVADVLRVLFKGEVSVVSGCPSG